ncbi:MAG: hypothetical protein B6D44_14050 [Ignavibacteriales bacterium UTCHB2]|jgi:type I restriction enzyme S subunit|nr:MAG: Type-1 restriction enzyme EcoKI specificity protein [Ignavibacteria bacterium ADurb.Bin266]OQY71110.1 MAG: hypothetical protein B6D44_14050 [Ignavibacteriales bacterium UTCHB2]HQI39789.1 restriction endonuclease subunit S [Ignavibacteriaceae bacterium]
MKSKKDINKLSALSALSGKNWSWVKLGDVCEFSQGIQVDIKKQSHKKLKNFVRFLRIIDFTQGTEEARFIENPGEKYYVNKDDLSMVRYGAVGFICRGLEGVIANNLFRIIPVGNVEKCFLFYFFKAPYFLNELKLNIKGATMPAISFSFIKGLNFPLPPLSEQKKIVEKIEELFSSLDSGIVSLKKAKEQFRLYRQSVLAFAFSGKLTTKVTQNTKNLSELSALSGLPQGWKWVKFIDFCKLQRGYDLVLSKIIEGKYPVVTSSGIKGYHNEFKANGPCLITGRSGGVGNIHFLKVDKYWPHNTVLFVKDFCGNYPEYMYYFFQQFNFKSFSASTTIPTLDRKQLYNEQVKVPSLKEQIKIVSEIEKRFSEADNLEKAIDESLAKSEALRQSILKQAFEGKLV